mmetsp:Transcript_30709/g.65801  ORF Transcript_30709/g.65801 Transcript_30709/m.65801 type:complete len:205 (+) Transcript_30709:1682-2296(+)
MHPASNSLPSISNSTRFFRFPHSLGMVPVNLLSSMSISLRWGKQPTQAGKVPSNSFSSKSSSSSISKRHRDSGRWPGRPHSGMCMLVTLLYTLSGRVHCFTPCSSRHWTPCHSPCQSAPQGSSPTHVSKTFLHLASLFDILRASSLNLASAARSWGWVAPSTTTARGADAAATKAAAATANFEKCILQVKSSKCARTRARTHPP